MCTCDTHTHIDQQPGTVRNSRSCSYFRKGFVRIISTLGAGSRFLNLRPPVTFLWASCGFNAPSTSVEDLGISAFTAGPGPDTGSPHLVPHRLAMRELGVARAFSSRKTGIIGLWHRNLFHAGVQKRPERSYPTPLAPLVVVVGEFPASGSWADGGYLFSPQPDPNR